MLAKETDDQVPAHRPRERIAMMKKVGIIEVSIYRHRNTKNIKLKKNKFKKAIKEVLEKVIKGQDISHSIE